MGRRFLRDEKEEKIGRGVGGWMSQVGFFCRCGCGCGQGRFNMDVDAGRLGSGDVKCGT